jgi:HEAT repeat protein
MSNTSQEMDKLRQMQQSAQEEERLAALRLLDRRDLKDFLPLIYTAFGDISWRIRKEATEMFLGLPPGDGQIVEVIRCLYSDDNAGLRNTAVEILTRLGRLAVPRLIAEAKSPDHDVRKFILDILGNIPDERSVPALRAALGDSDSNVRAAAAENLGRLGSVDAVPDLLAAMETPDLLLRFTILESLGQIDAFVPAERLLVFSDDRLLRKALVDCLGRVGDAAAVPFLVQCLSDAMRNVREAAVLALARLSTRAQTVIETVQRIRIDGSLSDTLSALLECGNADVRKATIALFGHLGDRGSVRQLLTLSSDSEMRMEAVSALMAMGRSDIGALIGVWPDVSVTDRAYLAYVFGEIEAVDAAALVMQGASDEDDELRQTCVQALGRVGGKDAVTPLVAALEDDSVDVREAALQALSHLGAQFRPELTRALTPLLEHEDSQVRMYAVTVIGRLDGDDIAAHLAFAIKDESSEVRSAAIRAIEGKGGSSLLPVLMLALTDEESEVRALAARALGQSGDTQAVKPLELALQDEDMWVRAAAVRSLGCLSGPDAETVVAGALADSVGLVGIAALETLEQMVPERISDYARHALTHRDDEVVSAALGLLQWAPDRSWLKECRAQLLGHSHADVRLHFARILAEIEGPECIVELEQMIGEEVDDFVRQELQILMLHLQQVEEN